MTKDNRKYISIYFEDGLINSRKKRDLTIAFAIGDPIYKKCKDLTSTEIKEAVGIFTYKELLEKSRKEGRTLNNYIKFKLRKKVLHE